MSVHKVYIIDGATDAPVEVELHDDLKVDDLLDVETQWAATRHDIRTKLTTLAVPRQSWPESLHWDWGRKSLPLAFRDPNDFRIMAVGRQPVWEAAVVTLCKNQVAALAPHAGSPLVYVDYLEVAPWNWKIDNVQARKFKAIGSVLLRASIEQSYAKGWEGRVGLHALPQAATFYVNQGLQFVRNDPNKQNLPYYELSAAEAFKRTGRSKAIMAHETLNMNITREWASEQAKLEPDSGVTSVGGLAHRISGLESLQGPARQQPAETAPTPTMSGDPMRQSLGKFIELSRRRMRLSVEQLADKANVDLAELLAVEKAEDVVPEPRTVYQLAQVLRVRVEPLLELAGLVVTKSFALSESAVRFAARSEPMDTLTKEEEEALNWFVKELSK